MSESSNIYRGDKVKILCVNGIHSPFVGTIAIIQEIDFKREEYTLLIPSIKDVRREKTIVVKWYDVLKEK